MEAFLKEFSWKEEPQGQCWMCCHAPQWLWWHHRHQPWCGSARGTSAGLKPAQGRNKVPPWHRQHHRKQQLMEKLNPGCILTQHSISPLLSEPWWNEIPARKPPLPLLKFSAVCSCFSISHSHTGLHLSPMNNPTYIAESLPTLEKNAVGGVGKLSESWQPGETGKGLQSSLFRCPILR